MGVSYKAKKLKGFTLLNPHVGITSLLLGDPWWGAPTKKKLNGFAIFIYRGSRSKCICVRAAPVNKKSCAMHSFSFFFVIRLGFEPKTHSLEGCCSIQLSYRTPYVKVSRLRNVIPVWGGQRYNNFLFLHSFGDKFYAKYKGNANEGK